MIIKKHSLECWVTLAATMAARVSCELDPGLLASVNNFRLVEPVCSGGAGFPPVIRFCRQLSRAEIGHSAADDLVVSSQDCD